MEVQILIFNHFNFNYILFINVTCMSKIEDNFLKGKCLCRVFIWTLCIIWFSYLFSSSLNRSSVTMLLCHCFLYLLSMPFLSYTDVSIHSISTSDSFVKHSSLHNHPFLSVSPSSCIILIGSFIE